MCFEKQVFGVEVAVLEGAIVEGADEFGGGEDSAAGRGVIELVEWGVVFEEFGDEDGAVFGAVGVADDVYGWDVEAAASLDVFEFSAEGWDAEDGVSPGAGVVVLLAFYDEFFLLAGGERQRH